MSIADEKQKTLPDDKQLEIGGSELLIAGSSWNFQKPRRMRKYDIHLPLNYSDGQPIEHEKIRRVRGELIAAFGSFAVPYRRFWKSDGARYVEIVRIEVITTGDKIPKKLLKDFKERLKESLRQIDILITTHGIQFI